MKKSINSLISKYLVVMNLQAVRVKDTMQKPCTWTGSKKSLVHIIEPTKLFFLIGKKLHNVDQLHSNLNTRGVASKMWIKKTRLVDKKSHSSFWLYF